MAAGIAIRARAEGDPAARGQDRPRPRKSRKGGRRLTAEAGPSTVAAFAPAKVNLYLHVTGRRADGYHELDSLVAFADIGDRLFAAAAARLSLSLGGPEAGSLAGLGADNLVLRAARRLAERSGVTAGAALHLEKNLPVAAGLGGGSSDAAAALKALAALWRLTPVRGSAPMCRSACTAGRPGSAASASALRQRRGCRAPAFCWPTRASRCRPPRCSPRGGGRSARRAGSRQCRRMRGNWRRRSRRAATT